MRIKTYLAAMVVVMILPLGLAALLAINTVREGEHRAALEALHATVRATALVVDREVQHSVGALEVLGRSEHFQTGNFQALYRQAQAMNRMPDVWTLVLDETGTQVFNTSVPFGTPPPPPSAKERVARVLATNKPFISDLIVGPVSGKLLTTLYVPAAVVNGKRYVVAQAFTVQHWKGTALWPETRPDWLVAVVDSHGRFIFRSQRTEELLGKNARPELTAALASEESGMLRHSTLEGVDVFDAFTHSKTTGWGVAVGAPVESIEASGAAAVDRLMAGTLVALLGAAVLAAYLGRKVVKGVERAAEDALNLGAGKEVKAQDGGLQEFNVLSSAMQDASRLLADAQNLRDISEAGRQKLLAAERVAKQVAENQNRKKDEFLAMLGHELRTPLAAISAASQLLDMRGDDPQARHRSTAIIARQNQHLQHIVDDLLDVSRLLAGKIGLALAPADLAACAVACVDAVRDTPKAHGYTLNLQVEPVWVQGDLSRLEQIINNLVSNALKYSVVGSTVDVSVKRRDDTAVLTVTDNGMGMEQDLLANVFEPFMQGPALGHRAASGLGIGLALVKQLVELHGGKVSALSAGPGKGSQFSIELPAIAAPAADGENSQSPQAQDANPIRLLLVEDNEDARLTMVELLRVMGVAVTAARDGAQAIALASAERFDAGVLDIGLPDMSGYDLARRLHTVQPALPLIALTGYGQKEDKAAASAAGFVGHVTKPAEIRMLLTAIRAAVA